MRWDVAPRIGLLGVFCRRALLRTVAGVTAALVLAGCAASPLRRAGPATGRLSVALDWVGSAGEAGELRLEGSLLRARLARRQVGAQPLFEAVYERRVSRDELAALARVLEGSGIESLPERLEDERGEAVALRLVLTRHGRKIVVRSRARRRVEIDRLLCALDELASTPLFATLPDAPPARGRDPWTADPRRAFEAHRAWFEAGVSDASIELDLWLLARACGDPQFVAWARSVQRDPEVRAMLPSLSGRSAAPMR